MLYTDVVTRVTMFTHQGFQTYISWKIKSFTNCHPYTKGGRPTEWLRRTCMKKNQLRTIISNLDLWIASIALASLIVLTLCGVAMRYIFGRPLTWLEEVQLFCMVWIVFAAGGAAFRTKSHVAIEMVVELFPKTVQKVLSIIIDILVVFALSYLFIRSIGYVQLFLRSGRTTSMLGIPFAFIYGIVPLSCIDMLISYFITEYLHSPAAQEAN